MPSDPPTVGAPANVSLLEVDPDLGSGVPDLDLTLAERAASTPVLALDAGPCDAAEWFERHPDAFGWYLIEGALVREVVAGPGSMPVILGPRDIVEPPVGSFSTLPSSVRLTALTPVRVAVLGPSVLSASQRWPSIMGAIQRRLAIQNQRAAALGAIGQISRVEVRVIAALWLLADDFGSVGRDGITVALPLTHRELGGFVGARRPTVSLALAGLAERGVVRRRDDGAYLLDPGAAGYLADALEEGGPPFADLGRLAVAIRERAGVTRSEAQAVRAEAEQARRRRAQLKRSSDPTRS
jgi:CRP-like cAMP-binding protein